MDSVFIDREIEKQPEGAVLIDLRDEDDYECGHIPGARQISMGSLREEIRRIARFNSPILLYDYTGKKSEQAAELLRSRGYGNARSIGGINKYTGRLEPELTVHELRTRKGLSQEALARAVGIRQPTVAAYESGKANPGPGIAATIREYFQVTIAPMKTEKTGTFGKRGRKPKETAEKTPAAQFDSVRELRKSLGLTQAAFAQSLDMSTGTIAAYEAGRIHPGTKAIAAIRQKYGIEMSATLLKKQSRKPGKGGKETG